MMDQGSVAEKPAVLGQHDDGASWTRVAELIVSRWILSCWSVKYRTDPTSHGLKRTRSADQRGLRIPAELIEASDPVLDTPQLAPRPGLTFTDPRRR